MIKILSFIALFLVATAHCYGEDLNYQMPSSSDYWRNIDDDFKEAYKIAIDPDNLSTWGYIIGSSALLYYYDEELIKEAQRVGEKLGIDGGGETNSIVILSLGPYPILKYPKSIGSGLYFLGDGSVHLGIIAGFASYSVLHDYDVKTMSVASQLLEGILDVGIATQFLKHVTGRQSPFKSTSPRGRWDLFPNQIDYANDVSNYDAFPSGHLATSMMTVTVLANNYPDNPYIKPIGYTLMGLLSFQMLNNEVHWASDYPLALGIGYVFGNIASSRAINQAREPQPNKLSWHLAPTSILGTLGVGVNFTY